MTTPIEREYQYLIARAERLGQNELAEKLRTRQFELLNEKELIDD